MEQTHCQVPDPVVTNSCTVVYRFQASSPPSYQQRVHVIFTALVARMHFWFCLVLAHHTSCSCICQRIQDTVVDLSLYRPGFHVQSSATASRHRRDSVVQLSIGHPMGPLSFALVSLTTYTSCRKNDKIRLDIFFFVIPSTN